MPDIHYLAHGITVVSPITKKSQSQLGILFVDNMNLWDGLGEEDDVISTPKKGQRSVNSWGSNLLAVRGELRPDKCSYKVHRMKPTDDGEWEYVHENGNTCMRR